MMGQDVNISIDGNKWCFSVGEDLQVGVGGFGDTPIEALMDLWANIPKWSKDPALLEWAKEMQSYELSNRP